MSSDFDLWRKELLQTGDIVQDGDTSVPQQEKEKRFNRYVEMVKAVSGQEGVEAFITLVESLQAKDDYGAYETTYGALWRFPPGVAARGLVAKAVFAALLGALVFANNAFPGSLSMLNPLFSFMNEHSLLPWRALVDVRSVLPVTSSVVSTMAAFPACRLQVEMGGS